MSKENVLGRNLLSCRPTGAPTAHFLLLIWAARGMEIRRGSGGCHGLGCHGCHASLYIEARADLPSANTLHRVHIRRCLPRPVSCHTPGSGAVSAMRDRHDLAQGLPAPRMLCTCTPGFGYPGCRIVASNLRRRPPSAAAVGKLRRRTLSASSVDELHQRAPSATSVSLSRQPAPSACTVGLRRRPAPSAYADS